MLEVSFSSARLFVLAAVCSVLSTAGVAGAVSLRAQVDIADPDGASSSQLEQDSSLVNPSLQLPPGVGIRGPSFVEAYGDDSGRVAAFARTGASAYEAQAFVSWRTLIVKDDPSAFFQFTLTPGYLSILHGDPATGENLIRPPYAEMNIVVFDDLGVLFEHDARIEGVGGDINTETFNLALETGDLVGQTVYQERVLPNPLFPDSVDSVRYDTPSFTGSVDLSGLAIGESRTIGYTILVSVGGDGDESVAEAFIGDPIDMNSGLLMSHGGVTLVPEPTGLLWVVGGAFGIAAIRSRRGLRLNPPAARDPGRGAQPARRGSSR